MIPWLAALKPCDPAEKWVASQGEATPEALWRACRRGDWLLWVVVRIGVDRRLVVLAACDCAEPALGYLPPGEQRPRQAIEVARSWARGEVTLAEVRAAADAASDAAAVYAYVYAYAHAASRAASRAADAASRAAAAADAAAYAADADAADADADADAATSLARSADLVRARIPWPLVAAALGGGR